MASGRFSLIHFLILLSLCSTKICSASRDLKKASLVKTTGFQAQPETPMLPTFPSFEDPTTTLSPPSPPLLPPPPPHSFSSVAVNFPFPGFPAIPKLFPPFLPLIPFMPSLSSLPPVPPGLVGFSSSSASMNAVQSTP